jgi:hypothetical protein
MGYAYKHNSSMLNRSSVAKLLPVGGDSDARRKAKEFPGKNSPEIAPARDRALLEIRRSILRKLVRRISGEKQSKNQTKQL